MISELRHDADLRCLYTGKQKARGRRGICDGKVRSDKLSRSESAGLPDCQSRCGISPDFRFDACMTALSLMKRESRNIAQSDLNPGCSVASVRIRNFDEYLLKLFCHKSGTDFRSVKVADAYQQIINHGAIAA